MNNHYISRLILRKFSDNNKTINSLLVPEQQLVTKKIKNTFQEKDLFPEEFEQEFCTKIEGPFGDLLNNKILKAEHSIHLTREENLLVRKFILLHSIRSEYNNRDIFEMMEKCQEQNNPFFQQLLKMGFKDMYPSRETYVDNLRKLLEINDIEKLVKQSEASFNVYAAEVAYICYFAFWDTTDSGLEYILPKMQGIGLQDNVSPLEKTRRLLEFQEQRGKFLNKLETFQLNRICYGTMCYPENFHIIPFSPTRALIVISPYFRAFFDEGDNQSFIPAFFQKKDIQRHFSEPFRIELLTPCKTFMNQAYQYPIWQLKAKEAREINCLFLNEEPEEFVFHDYNKIRDSFWSYEYETLMRKKKHQYKKFVI